MEKIIDLKHEPAKAANTLIQARFNYTALELDLMALIMRKVNVSQYVQIELDLNAVTEIMGDSHNNFAYIRKAARGLLSKPLEFYDKKSNTYLIANIISAVKIDAMRSKIYINIDQFVYPLLYNLREQYTLFQINSIFALDSKYAKRIYLMCSQFKNLSFNIELTEFKTRLGILGQYNQFSDLKKRVLIDSINAINERTELQISLADTQQGRLIENLSFTVQVKNEIQSLEAEASQVQFMRLCGLAQWQIATCLQQRDPMELHEILAKVSAYIQRNKKIGLPVKDTGKYLYTVLQNSGIDFKNSHARQYSLLTAIQEANKSAAK